MHGNTKRKRSLTPPPSLLCNFSLTTQSRMHSCCLVESLDTAGLTFSYSVSKQAVWRVYREAVGTVHAVAYSTFCLLWRTLVPSIVIMKPRSDLCWKCQQNSTAIMRTANASDAEKSSTIDGALEHLRIIRLERSFYKSICGECKESVRAHFVTNGDFSPPQLASQLKRHQGSGADLGILEWGGCNSSAHSARIFLRPRPFNWLVTRVRTTIALFNFNYTTAGCR